MKTLLAALIRLALVVFVLGLASDARACATASNPAHEAIDSFMESLQPAQESKKEYTTHCWQQSDGQIFCETE